VYIEMHGQQNIKKKLCDCFSDYQLLIKESAACSYL